MEIVPDDLVIDILFLLPIATLLRFRCVSKRWRDIIDSPDFTKPRNKAHTMLIFLVKQHAYHVHLDSIRKDPVPILKRLANPCLITRVRKQYGVVGPCNGLLCMATNENGIFCLWNPSIGKHFHVPNLPLELSEDMLVWGLGYACDSDDYKIVCISFNVWVYSVKCGSWESIGHFPHISLECPKRGVFVNNALHWIVYRDYDLSGSKLIVAFDLEKLECSLVPQPESMQNKIKIRCVGVLDGCLYAVYRGLGVNTTELWVMKEYGVKESWARLIAFPGYVSVLTPLSYTEAGDLMLWFSAGRHSTPVVMRYEFETGSMNKMEPFKDEFRNSLLNLHSSLVYVPSLVCPQIPWNSCVTS